MKFRPCIDLHEGCVKQIVGGTLTDDPDAPPTTNFSSDRSSDEFAELYRDCGLYGGHVIMLGKGNDQAALAALAAFKGGMQVGGGITPSNALKYLEAGASQVIVTSYVFREGKIDFERLEELFKVVGRDKLVLDLSCRKRSAGPNDAYYVVTDRWQKFTDFEITEENLVKLAKYCCEFLVHGVDVEGTRVGVMGDLVEKLGRWSPIPVTYAGGARSMEDFDLVKLLGRGKVDLTVGSALDIFGGDLKWQTVVKWHYANLFEADHDLFNVADKELRARCLAARASLEADKAAASCALAFKATLEHQE
ncbi:1-(5-phosphoribosyl)-5-[(5-phosphoribosylamino)methylideneamino] imidazole-4-carboxamide isomerase [Durusdinium trenchii]|uniref:1-(5-phosphoribosyl)-5-[(5-phosphoribosylamino)methylideneamino]imidazole-4-carboxamideisomerase n=1 Tax=Durusdinium trenchii TaxID=1381693 RepID=A0ABP0I516_9DINO